jgi:hypothetical protein
MLSYIFGGLLAAVGIGTIVLKLLKGSNAEALNANLDTKAKVIDIQRGINKDQNDIISEADLRLKLQQQLDDKEKQNATKDELLDFANKP